MIRFRKFILYPLMDLIFNYKTRVSSLVPMNVILAGHPANSKRLQKLDIRTITYEDWKKHVALYNYNKLNRFTRQWHL